MTSKTFRILLILLFLVILAGIVTAQDPTTVPAEETAQATEVAPVVEPTAFATLPAAEPTAEPTAAPDDTGGGTTNPPDTIRIGDLVGAVGWLLFLISLVIISGFVADKMKTLRERARAGDASAMNQINFFNAGFNAARDVLPVDKAIELAFSFRERAKGIVIPGEPDNLAAQALLDNLCLALGVDEAGLLEISQGKRIPKMTSNPVADEGVPLDATVKDIKE